MKLSDTVIITGLLAVSLLPAMTMAQESSPFSPVTVSEEKMALMDIRVQSPQRGGEEAGVPLAAEVVIPPGNERVVSAPEAARVESLAVAEGDEVKKEQALAVLLSPDLLTLQKDYLQAVAGHALAQRQYERDKQLVSEGIVAARRLQESQTQLSNQSVLVQQQVSMLKIAGFSEADIRSLKRSGKLRQRITLRSPLNGVVLERRAEVGQQLAQGDVVFDIADLSSLWLQLRIPVGMKLETGQKASVMGRPVTAEVVLIGKRVDPDSQTYFARAQVITGADRLRASEVLSVRLSSGGQQMSKTLALPRSSLVSSEGRDYVFVRTPGGFVARPVNVAGFSGQQVFLSSGVMEGDKVAVAGVAALKGVALGLGGDE
ncbi:MAG: efflux RND transporter periplasmic adaptor subunit [bacterium]